MATLPGAEQLPLQLSQGEADYTSPLHRVNDEFLHLTVVRDTVGIAQQSPATYDETIQLARRLASTLFDKDSITLARQLELNLTIREYRQIAESESNRLQTAVSVEKELDAGIRRYKELLENAPARNRDRLQHKLKQLVKARNLLSGHVTEDEVIWHDTYARPRCSIEFAEGPGYTVVPLRNGRVLRIQIVHRKRPENLLGADVLLELHHPNSDCVRIVAIQYKMWDGEKLLFSQAPDLRSQLDKLKEMLCNRGFCANQQPSASPQLFRLPHCSAFLRPTDKLQAIDDQMKSSGFHIPLCVVERSLSITKQGRDQIQKDDFLHESMSHAIFDELLDNEMVGSQWIPYSALRDLYAEIGAEFRTKTFCHAQILSSSESFGSLY